MPTTCVTKVVWKIDFYRERANDAPIKGTLTYEDADYARTTFQFMKDQANHNGCPVALSLYSETTYETFEILEVY